MPIYAYRCAACGHSKDVLQKLSDPPLVDCPACGAPEFRKQLTAAGFQLKGNGWYVTDFKDGPAAKSGAKSEDAESGEAKSADAKSAGDGKSTEGATAAQAKPASETKGASGAAKTGAPVAPVPPPAPSGHE